MEGIELQKQKSVRMFGEKENYKYLGILEVNTKVLGNIRSEQKRNEKKKLKKNVPQ